MKSKPLSSVLIPGGPVRLVVFLAVLMAGCSGPKTVSIVIDGAGDMNTTSGGPGNAAEIRVYQMNNRVNFDNAGPRRFWEDDISALGPELIGAPVQLSVFPNQSTEELEVVIAKETRYVGIAANLREPDGSSWKRVYTVDEIDDNVTRFLVAQGSLILKSELDTDEGMRFGAPRIPN